MPVHSAPAMIDRMVRYLLMLIFLLQLGCAAQAGLTPPEGWREVTAAPGTPADDATCVMQVFICYTPILSSHACMRIAGPDGQQLFWDPGGAYGIGKEGVVRQGDLLVDDHALSVDDVWHYRSVGCAERTMVMFQWNLTPQQARARRNVLIQGSDDLYPRLTFDSATPGGFCSINLSAFLMQFAQEKPALPRKWFWPGNLGRHLWTQQPDSVWIFQRDHQPVVTLWQRVPAGDHAMANSGR